MKSPLRLLSFGLAGVVVTSAAASAHAAGLYFSDRGVRPVGRAGAFVAGADDLGSIWYNPAGVGFAGDAVLADFSWLRFGSTFQRRTLIRDANGQELGVQGSNYYPEVSGTSPLIPLPTLAISNSLGLERWNFAFGMYAPYAALTSYPEQSIAFQGRQVPAPQRYSLITLNGSALAVLALHAAYKPTERLAIGFGLQMLAGNFVSKLAFSACPPSSLICASEQPDYDTVGQLTVGPIFAPSGNLGVIGIVSDTASAEVRVGASFQLPFWVNAPAKVKLQLPAAPEFRNASVEGEDARVTFRLPPIARAGIEARLGEKKATRLEVSVFYEAWSFHDAIKVAPAGNGIYLHNVVGFPDPYQVGTLELPKKFRDTYSLHGGAEHSFDLGGYPMMLRAGVSYERSAVPPAQLSVQTVDLDKIQLAVGASLFVAEKRNLRLDAVLAHTFGFATDVDPHEAAVTRIHVVRANYPAGETAVNGGRYTAQADVVGVGLNWKY